MPRNIGSPTSRMIGLFMGLGNSERAQALDALKAIQAHGNRPVVAKGKKKAVKPAAKTAQEG